MIKACLQIYRESLSFATFLRVHSNSKEVSCFYWQNSYPNLKTICDIKAKFFLWNKLLESLLLAKYLISVASTLNVYKCIYRNLIERKCHYYIYLIPFVQYFCFIYYRFIVKNSPESINSWKEIGNFLFNFQFV